MPNRVRRPMGSAPAICMLVLSVYACDRLLGHRIEVVFRTVDGLESGNAVYLRGIRIGTTGAPFLREGRAIVPVYIRDLSALPSRGAVFLLTEDPHDRRRKSLAGFSLGSDSVAADRPRVYTGAANELELVVLVGAAKARQFLEELMRFLSGTAG